MSDPLEDLRKLDPSDSMSDTLAHIVAALDIVESRKSDPHRAEALALIAEKEKEAFEYFLRPLDDDTVYNRLIALHLAMDDGSSVARYRRAIDIRQARKWTVMGDAQAVVGNNSKAVHYLKRAMFFGPMEDVEGEVRSALERSEKRVQKAQKEIEKALEKVSAKPDSEKALLEAGNHLMDLDRLDEAAKTNKKLLAILGTDSKARYQQGCILFSKGEYKKALKVFEELHGENPDSLNVKRCMNWTLQMIEGV
jgi:tetratricopeptide (TPR) repeat protein